MLKIVHVIGSLDPDDGGPPAVASRLAAAQSTLGHRVGIVFRESAQRQQQTRLALRGLPGITGVELVALGPPKGINRLLGRDAKPVITAQIKDADMVHLHGVWEPVVFLSARVARRCGVPYALTPHGMLDPWSLAQRQLKKRLALMLGYRRMLSEAAYLHVLNADEARLIGPLGLASTPVVIPNGIFVEEFEPLPKRGGFYDGHPELGGRPYVLFLGRLHYKKGLDYLAQAFQVVAQQDNTVRLVVAGPDGGERCAFEQMIAQAGLTERVHVVGPVYGDEKISAMVDAACFCLPSRQEGFSMATTEALACGVPVVISDACHFPEVAEAGAGMVVGLDIADLARALQRILEDPQSRDRMGQAGRDLVASRYTWPKIAQQTIQAYEATRDR